MEKSLSYGEYKEHIQQKDFHSGVSILLDRIQSLENFALICRTAESLNISTIYLYKAAIENKPEKLKRISRSTSEKLSIEKLSLSHCKLLSREKKFIGIEVTNQSEIIYNHSFDCEELILVGGSENKGISEEIIQLCSSSFHLPIVGDQSSINLACALSSAMHWVSFKQLQNISHRD